MEKVQSKNVPYENAHGRGRLALADIFGQNSGVLADKNRRKGVDLRENGQKNG